MAGRSLVAKVVVAREEYVTETLLLRKLAIPAPLIRRISAKELHLSHAVIIPRNWRRKLLLLMESRPDGIVLLLVRRDKSRAISASFQRG